MPRLPDNQRLYYQSIVYIILSGSKRKQPAKRPISSEENSCNSPGRNGNPLANRVKSDFSTDITYLDDT